MKEATMEYITVVTANMGSCQCGNCCCRVYADGDIQYVGEYPWQCSPKRAYLGEKEPRREYGSQLEVGEYRCAMGQLSPA